MRWNLFKSVYMRKKKTLAVAFYSTFRYIEDVLSIKNNLFDSHVDSIFPNEVEIKGTKECSTSASYLHVNILLKLDAVRKLMIQLCDKRDGFNFSIVNFPYLHVCTNIPVSPACGVYILQLIWFARACSTYDQVLIWGSLLTNKLMSQGFLQSH
jgi:hypothetical protein